MKIRPLIVVLAALCSLAGMGGCVSSHSQVGGIGSAFARGIDSLEDEPPPVPPNTLMDPYRESHGILSLRFVEDLEKTASGEPKDAQAPAELGGD
ncbi:MAG: hypothetical protein KDM91_09305 [Verrucomicrobiae bacterium]|nr:hypothetical protein [Verrucomicrobiae bacterium]MCP5550274.1 hypothetical protein [Akkermansiaceae bacterium]